MERALYTRALVGQNPYRACAWTRMVRTVACEGPIAGGGREQKLTAAAIDGHMMKPEAILHNCVGTEKPGGGRLYLSQSAVNELRRELLYRLTEERSKPPVRRTGCMPTMPVGTPCAQEPQAIFQVRTAEQLTPELASLKLGIYTSRRTFADNFFRAGTFTARGAVPVAVMLRVITDGERRPEDP